MKLRRVGVRASRMPNTLPRRSGWRAACIQKPWRQLMTQPQAINWNNGVDQAIERARNEQRNVLLDFTAAPM